MALMLFLILSSLFLIDQPDIEFLNHGTYAFQLRFGPEGEIIGFGSIGLWDRLMLGMSYGASNLIGPGNPEFYRQLGIQVRGLLLEPGIMIPGIIFGFDNQGYGEYDTISGYDIHSKGFYSEFGWKFDYPELKFVPCLGMNYSFEDNGRFDIFSGMTIGLSSLEFILEYSPNFFDEKDNNKGYMNTGIRFVFYQQLFFEFALRDLLGNSSKDQQLNRMIKIGYQESF